MEALETSRHHGHTRDTSYEEVPEEEEESIAKNPDVKILKSIFGAGSSSKADVPFYNRSLYPEELIDRINAMNKHFDYAEVKEDKQARLLSQS